MSRTLKVILIVIATLFVLGLGYAVINIVTGGSLESYPNSHSDPLDPNSGVDTNAD